MSEPRRIPLADDERSVTLVFAAAVVRKATALAIQNDTTIEELLASLVTREVGKLRLMSEVCDE